MPLVNGKFVAPRGIVKRAKNAPLVALYLMVDLLDRELKANGGDWDKVLSSVRTLRGEAPGLRRDDILGGYQGMAQFIQLKVRQWGAS